VDLDHLRAGVAFLDVDQVGFAIAGPILHQPCAFISDRKGSAGMQCVFLETRLVGGTVYFDFPGAGVPCLDIDKILESIAVAVRESPHSVIFWREDSVGGEDSSLVRHDREVERILQLVEESSIG
jgi:hypothetical protein